MPGGDRTGPLGLGPRTGRGAGYCRGNGVPGYANQAWGGGRGMGRGFAGGGGRGRRNRYYATGLPGWARAEYYNNPLPEFANRPAKTEAVRRDELAGLRAEALNLSNILTDINKRIEELENKNQKEGM